MSPQLPAIHEIWVYLSGSPLLALVLTLSAYQAGRVDFGTLLDAQRQIRRTRLDLLKVQLEQQMRLAEIERIVGEDL